MAGLMVAGAALGAFFNVVFERLDSPLVVDFFRGKNLDPLLLKLRRTLKVVNAVLDDAEKKQFGDPNVKDWFNDLKDAVYMADDLLDEVSTKEAVATHKEVTSNLLSHISNAQDEGLASRLAEIVDTLEHILKLKESLDLKAFATDNSLSRVESTSVPDGKIYGRDKDKKAIIELLLDGNNGGDEQVAVIPIVGMGGVGKTTLAQMVYHDEGLVQNFNFDLKAWVCVSEQFDIIKVTKNLIETLTKEACKINDFNSLQENLVQILRGKKFFIILDDVWNEDYDRWNQLKKPFLHGMRGSKIIVTTRSDEVASVVQTDQTFHLSQLSNKDCWSVFANHACLSPGSGENTIALEKIGLEIVKKCKGLPLAAQSLGGLLRRKRNIKDWNNVLNSDIWELSESECKVIPSLRISYHYLPPYLKRCFVYCSLYPKDFEFEKDNVVLLWMAEDLLPPPKQGKTLKEVGHECFDYLVSSSFLQRSSKPWKKGYFGMHDLMHDLATFIGGEFYFRSDGLGEETKIGRKTRHLSFINYSSPSSENFGLFNGSKFVRTFLRTKHEGSFYESVDALCTELTNLECLRVLSFRSSNILNALPDSIGGLIHLRFLDFSRTTIESLPESLCNLYNLQTLKLEYCHRLNALPSGMQKLVNLNYLGIALGIDGTRNIEEMPKGMGKLKQLQHLPYFIVGKHEEIKIKELGGLSNLGGSFTIKKLENVENGSEALEARMMDKKHIEHLVLKWSLDVEDCMDSQTEMDILCKLEPHQDLETLRLVGYRGTRYPDWVGKPCFHNMTCIELSNCKNCFTLPSLGGLPSLRELSIYDMKSLVTIGASFFNNNDGGSLLTVVPFPSLESLEFTEMPCWEVWSCSDQPRAFPKLKRLRIEDCPKLKGDLPSDLPALEKLKIQDCKQLACSLPRAPAMRDIIIGSSDGGSLLTVVPFPKLESLEFRDMPCWEVWSCFEQPRAFPQLKFMRIEDCPKLKGDLPSHLPQLKRLTIASCPKLKGDLPSDLPALERLEIQDCKQLAWSLPRAPAMRYLTIHRCDSLTSLALDTVPNLKELSISKCEKLESVSLSQSGDGDVTLQNLTLFQISNCLNLVSLAREGLPAPSLTRFTVSNCDKLESLPPRMNTLLPNLKSLDIRNCPRIESFPEQGGPPSLKSIEIWNCEKLVSGFAWPSMDLLTSIQINGPCDGIKSFPKEGLLPPSLKELLLVNFSSLETLDCKGLLHLTSLRELNIQNCRKLENMAGERLPASLTQLYIIRCPLLGEQCRTKHPQIWPKISHIHRIQVNGEVIS